MTIKEVKGKLYDAISQDNMDDAIGLLLDAVDARSSKFAQLEGIRKEYNFLKTKILQRSVKTEDAIITSNALAGQVLDFFHDLDKKDLLTDGAYSDKLIMNPILFITHSTDDNEDLEVFRKC